MAAIRLVSLLEKIATCVCCKGKNANMCVSDEGLKLPCLVVSDRLDGPLELVSQRLGKELLNRNVGLGREYNGQAWVDVVLA